MRHGNGIHRPAKMIVAWRCVIHRPAEMIGARRWDLLARRNDCGAAMRLAGPLKRLWRGNRCAGRTKKRDGNAVTLPAK